MPDHVRISRLKVLDTLKTNKELHRKEFEEAMTGWIEKTKEMVSKISVQLESDKASETELSIFNQFPKPLSFEKEYERAIKMIELDVRLELDISSNDFDRFFLDEWAWKNSFLSNTQIYKSR